MKERSALIGLIRQELVGPSAIPEEPTVATLKDGIYNDPEPDRIGPLFWQPYENSDLQEILYFYQESPYRKYGAGLLHPSPVPGRIQQEINTNEATDTIGVDLSEEDLDDLPKNKKENDEGSSIDSDDFDLTSPDTRRPSTMGISICVSVSAEDEIILALPEKRRFEWQHDSMKEQQLNGRYEKCERHWIDAVGRNQKANIWRRIPIGGANKIIKINGDELLPGKVLRRKIDTNPIEKLSLRFEVFPRKLEGEGNWLLTIVLRNITAPNTTDESKETTMYQTYFEVSVDGGKFLKYPESQRPFEQLDQDEKSLLLLYQENATWAIGHGCSAGWDSEPSHEPVLIYADIMPAVQLPSMTPDIIVDGEKIKLSMRSLANLSDGATGEGWESIDKVLKGYRDWIEKNRIKLKADLSANLQLVANEHLDKCNESLERMINGVEILMKDKKARDAFKMANLAMLLQQIGTKQLKGRALDLNSTKNIVSVSGDHLSPWDIYVSNSEDPSKLGTWRAFQISFLLMSIKGVISGSSLDREIVDLVWFPTGGGKTEAYLGVMAFYMFYQRLLTDESTGEPDRDGTNVLMRYTLRMLTTQQFQRAAALICSMEYIRRNHSTCGFGEIPGRRFSLGLWIGGEGTPNNTKQAATEIRKFQKGDEDGNPLVLTECPWCRSQIGRYEGKKPLSTPRITEAKWHLMRTRGIVIDSDEGPLLCCPDNQCEFGQEDLSLSLPIEVIDERIYRYPPSLIVATADKLAMTAYRPGSASLFGRMDNTSGELIQKAYPPGLIIQDELHLISGPLGTMYALYEGVIEKLCSFEADGLQIKPKIVASTATIRGASDQVKSLYNRSEVQLFPSPGLDMGDSFFGVYARENNKLADGRLYLGILAADYGSILTAQVRAFSAALFQPWLLEEDERDPWWTLLSFYNSIRELGGAKTLFDSDIRSRLKYLFNREGFPHDKRRNLKIVEELTSRLSQAEIVSMMDKLAIPYDSKRKSGIIDACLASNIIEVGVDIDRLSVMGVVGQPKTTATYIQVTGRVGRRWWERPGLILMMYSPSKSRDRSHYEQFHSYHRRLYERVEPTSATPFAISAIHRGFAGTLLAWVRQNIGPDAPVQNLGAYLPLIEEGFEIQKERCLSVQTPADAAHSINELEIVKKQLIKKWGTNPQNWEEYPHDIDGEYLMLWPGQFATAVQTKNGVVVPSSMRQVDGNGELTITQGYIGAEDQDSEGV